jgi:hypothetical protein
MAFRNYATEYYGQSITSVKLPKQKFYYYVKFDLSDGVAQSLSAFTDKVFGATTVNLPGTTYNTTTNNSYNTKVINITGKNYTPVTMGIIDDQQGDLNQLHKLYDQNIFNKVDDTRQTNRQMQDFTPSKSEGLKLSTKNFFERIHIFHLSDLEHNEAPGTHYTLFRPVMISFARDTLDYGAGAESTLSQVTFEYENYNHKTIGTEDKEVVKKINEGLAPPQGFYRAPNDDNATRDFQGTLGTGLADSSTVAI